MDATFQQATTHPHFRPRYHLTSATGRINDPNGMYVENGQLHAYFQKDPQWPLGKKRTGWGHAVTPLTPGQPETWSFYPDALAPAMPYDKDGCYSGCAVLVDGQLELFYTGNAKVNGERFATQNLVHVLDRHHPTGGAHLRAAENPLIPAPAPGFTAHYRDPQVLFREDQWWLYLGAQRENETGTVVAYTSPDRRHWSFAGELEFDCSTAVPGDAPDLVPAGYMWECPNLLQLVDEADGQVYDILIILPQGLPAQGEHYANNHQCGYLVGKLTGTKFQVKRGFSELDRGHEFYAPQVAAGRANTEPALLLGWMGLPDQDDQPSREQHWVHALTMLRQLSLRAGVVYQTPHGGAYPAAAAGFFSEKLTLTAGDTLTACTASGETAFTFSFASGQLTFDRSGNLYQPDNPVRQVALPAELASQAALDLEVFVDGSAVEIFVAGGRFAFSSRIFTHTPITSLQR